MNNRLKPEEMFVVIPSKYLESLLTIMTAIPDARAVLEATKPEDSDYWKKETGQNELKKNINQLKGTFDSKISMSWSAEAKAMIAKAPSGILEMAINNVEDFAGTIGLMPLMKML